MTETKAKAKTPETMRVEIIGSKPIPVLGRGDVFPGSVIEVKTALGAHLVRRKLAKESNGDLNMVIPEHIADQLGIKSND